MSKRGRDSNGGDAAAFAPASAPGSEREIQYANYLRALNAQFLEFLHRELSDNDAKPLGVRLKGGASRHQLHPALKALGVSTP